MNLSRMHRWTRDLIALDSVTGKEAVVTDYLSQELPKRGWVVQSLPVAEDRVNLLAKFEDAAPEILFNTHIDTVPGVYGPEEDAERFYGRGACDTKGILAAMLEALEDARDDGMRSLGLLLVVGEERDHIGARCAGADPQLTVPRVLVVGEPTENRFLTSQKGVMSGTLVATGKEGHSGYPECFDSAVSKLIPALQALQQASWLAAASSKGTTLNISLLSGGDAFNKVPGRASASLMFRLSEPATKIRVQTEECLQDFEVQLCWDDFHSECISHLNYLSGQPTGVAAFNTDISYFGWETERCYLLGPGSILQAHRDLIAGDLMAGEWMSKRSQEEGVARYLNLLRFENQ